MGWPLLSVEDLAVADVTECLRQAERLRTGDLKPPQRRGTVALLFLEPSLRTRTGFVIAANDLGLQPVEVYEPRYGETSMPESWADTLQVMADVVDLVVARPATAFDRAEVNAHCDRPLISGGDRGENAEHPTQALIDLFAIQRLAPEPATSVVLLGDPSMRAARSLIRLLAKVGGFEVAVIADRHHHLADERVKAFLTANGVRTASPADLQDLDPDVLYVTGMHHASLPLDRRDELILTKEMLVGVPERTIVLSPLPVIDEIGGHVIGRDTDVRSDPRMQYFEQSRLGRFVRTAIMMSALAA